MSDHNVNNLVLWAHNLDLMMCFFQILNIGAHTLGVARCSSFKNRLSKFDATHDVDPSLDSDFAQTLSKTCSAGDKAEQPFDNTRNDFDNDYEETKDNLSKKLKKKKRHKKKRR